MTRTRRHPRGERSPASPVDITDRDLDLLTLIGLTGYVSTEQVAREFFPSPDRSRRRLRQLFDAGLLTVTLRGSTRSNLVSLTKQGADLVLERRPDLTGRIRLSGAIRLPGVAHHLAVVDARLFLAALGEQLGHPLLVWQSGQLAQSLRRNTGAQRLIPDGVAEFEVGTRTIAAAVEVDCGTEGRPVLARKLGRYTAAFNAGNYDLLFLVGQGGARRLEGLAGLAREAGLGNFTVLLDHEQTLWRPIAPPLLPAGGREEWAEGPNTLLFPKPIREADRSVQTPRLVPDRCSVRFAVR